MILSLDMVSYVILLVAACLFVEGLIRLPVMQRVVHMRQTLQRIRFVLTAKSVSDHWKEKVLLAYASMLWRDSAVLLLCLGLLAIPLLLVFEAFSRFGLFERDLLSAPAGLVLATGAGAVYALGRARCRKSANA